MPRPVFKGSITTTGRSEALRLDKALFRAHPEFRQKAKIRAHVIGPGSMLVTLDQDGADPPADEAERDPVLVAYLSFIEADMTRRPGSIAPIAADRLVRLETMTRGVVVSDEDVLPDDVTM